MLRDTASPFTERFSGRYPKHSDSVVDHFSNTSEDAYGLEGAFAEIADSLARAIDYIFIAGWMFEPWVHLPCYGEYLRKALVFHHQGDLENAIAIYQKIIHKDIDNNGYAAFFLACAYYQQENRAAAKTILVDANQKHPFHRDLSLSLSRIYLEQGQLEEALELIKFLIKKQDVEAYAILAEYHQRNNDDESALQIYENMVRFDALRPVAKAQFAYQGLGSIYLYRKEYKNAEEKFRRCLWFYPQDIHSLIGLAQTLQLNPEMKHHSIPEIDECYSEALYYLRKQFGHENTTFFKKIIREYALWASDHEFGSYIELISRAIELNPDDPILFLAKLKFLLKNAILDDAVLLLSQCENYLKYFPNNVLLHQAMIKIANKSIESEVYAALILKHSAIVEIWGNSIDADFPPLAVTVHSALQEIDLRMNRMGFHEGLRNYRDTLPELGETLIRKALANPEMVIAINLWQQYGRPGEKSRFKFPIQELKKIAEKLGLPFPKNILIRTNHCRDFFNSHHQKYIVMDDGRGDSTAYIGSCDLSGKFEWSEHLIKNTAENDCAIDRHYSPHDFENMRYSTRRVDVSRLSELPFRIPRGPWREVISKVRGSVCADFVKEFQARWAAKAGGALSGYTGEDDNDLIATLHGGVQVRGSLDLALQVKLKKESVLNRIKMTRNLFAWNTCVRKYRLDLEEKNQNPLINAQETRKKLQDLYREAYQRLQLHKKEWLCLKKQYPNDDAEIEKMRVAVEAAENQYKRLITLYLQVSDDAQRQILDEEFKADEPVLCATQIISSTQKNYYQSNWLFKGDIDSSIQASYVKTINNAEHFIYLENQYFVCYHKNIATDPIIKALLDKIIAKASTNESFHIYLNLPYSPNGEPGDGVFVDPVRKTEYEVIHYMMQTIEEKTQKHWSQFFSINFFAQWNGVDSQRAARLSERNAISRIESQSISQRAPIYNHAKILIADGTTIINGSANISERSMSGKSDTELAIMQTSIDARSKRKMEYFMLKILRQYYGETVASIAESRLAQGLDLGLGVPQIIAMIQRNTWENLQSFSSNEPGHAATKERGFAVAFPYKREFGYAGEIAEGFEFIPDAPRDAHGNHPDAFRWLPKKELPYSLAFARWTGKTS